MAKSQLIPLIKTPTKPSSSATASRHIINLARQIPSLLKKPNWQESLTNAPLLLQDDAIPSLLSLIPDPHSALAFFRWAPQSPLVHSALLSNLARHGLLHPIGPILHTMQAQQIIPTREAFSSVIGAYSRSGLHVEALAVISSMRETTGSLPHSPECNCLLKLLVEKGRFVIARELYDEMLERGLADNYSTCTVVRGLCLQGRVEEGRRLVEDRWGEGCIPNVVFYNTLIDGYFRNGEVGKGFAMFRGMELKGFLPTVVSYGVVVNGFVRNGRFEELEGLIDEMKSRGLRPNVEIYNSVVDALCNRGWVREAKAVLRRMIGDDGCEPDVVTCNILITGLCRIGKVGEGERILRAAIRRRLSPNNLSYCPLIHGYCKIGEVITASNLILEMVERGHKPDLVTYGALIHGLVFIGKVCEAMEIREKMLERGLHPDANMYNVLISGLNKKGMLPSAKMLLNEMLDQNIWYPKSDPLLE